MDAIDQAIERKRQAEAELEAEKKKTIDAIKAELKALAVQASGWLKEIEAYAPTVIKCVDKIEKTDFVKQAHVASLAANLRATATNNPNAIREGLKEYNQLSTGALRAGIRLVDRAAGIKNYIKTLLMSGCGCRNSLEAGVKSLYSLVEQDEQRREYERSVGMPPF